MRLRNIPRADETVSASSFVINEPAELRGRWNELFGNDNPIRIEVGMGKGRFLRDLAALNPDVNYVGIERYTSVLLRAVERVEQEEPTNFYFMCEDAAILPEQFAPGEVDRIYLNFSDPWPKKGHAKRRLTSTRFLEVYDKILKADGVVEFKTDNQDLFTFSLESAEEANWEILGYTRDLHHDPMCEGNVMTEYEEKFSSQGNPICKMVICRKK